jgi:putative aldouronate transport system permease protein
MDAKVVSLVKTPSSRPSPLPRGRGRAAALCSDLRKQYQKQLMVLLGIAFLAVFAYYPMYGVQIAFKRLSLRQGIWASPWIGFEHFRVFLVNSFFQTTLINTLKISLTSLILVFPAPILFALLLNEVTRSWHKRFVQTVSYLPHFVSWVVVAGMVYNMLGMDGLLNNALVGLGAYRAPRLILGQPRVFLPLIILSSLWKTVGYSSIIYLSAISGIDPQLYEAAVMDGASRLRRVVSITIPCIAPTIAILFIFQCAGLLDTSFDQVYLLQNPAIISVSETIDTYAYKVGIESARFEYGAAVGLFKAIIGMALLLASNAITRRLTAHGLW